MTDQLIERLVDDLKPQDLLIDSKLWAHCTVCLIVLSGAVLVIMGLRTDYPDALENGAMFWKPGIFLVCWIGSIFLILDFSRPTGKINKWHFTPILLAIAVFLWQIITQLPIFLTSEAITSLYDPNNVYLPCRYPWWRWNDYGYILEILVCQNSFSKTCYFRRASWI